MGLRPTRIQILTMAYVDGELSEAERLAFQSRLDRDPRLGREVAELRTLNRLLREAQPSGPDASPKKEDPC